MKKIYLDHASTTPVDKEVLKAMKPYFSQKYGNASSLHSFGREAKKALEKSREQVAKIIGAKSEEIIFTGGGTESDNIAIKGVAFRMRKGHIITSKIEHPAVMEMCRHLEQKGFEVTYLPVDKYGIINPDDVKNAIKDDTILITIMHANNEIGTIEPIEEIAKIAKENGVPFHTDAVQSVGKIPIDVKNIGVDMLSISAHKIYGPKGTGALYVREGTKIEPIVHGGGHERGLRSSTENIPGIVGLGRACELAKERMNDDAKRITWLRDKLIKGVLEIEETYLNGHPEKRLANNAHFRFTAIEGESLVLSLDGKGIAGSTGSACSSKKLRPSHVLMAIGLNEVQAHGSLRLTLGRENTEDEIEYVLEVLPGSIEKLRKMSPLWGKI
ncbi:MAG: cysteine desulfurase NifS [Candidatus Thermoplasmatota archaeon]|nr:cysteine desulfurase NifS [Candidatus Thermoplasmatota archaeon]